MATFTFSSLDTWNTQNNQITSTGLGTPSFTATFNVPLSVDSTFSYKDGNNASFSGNYSGTNSNGDLIFHNGGSYYVLTNHTYHVGDTLTVNQTPFVCFLSGTLIRTPKGDVAVETLQKGDLVVTSSGERRPVKWIGHRDIRLEGRHDARSYYPVRIAAGAFGDNRPSKDLYVSGAHSVCIDLCGEVLIPAGLLVNGSTVAQTAMDEVSYWHVELDSHDILLANNLPAESYIAMENRGFFAEAGATLDAFEQGGGRSYAAFCRPVVTDGPVLAFVRERLKERAKALGWTPSCDPELSLLVDGDFCRPLEEDGTAVFLLPANAREARLRSNTFSPALLGESGDPRELGLCVLALSFSDARGQTRPISLDDDRLEDSFYPDEAKAGVGWRWTKGELILKPDLWSGLSGPAALVVAHSSSAVRRWVSPAQQGADTEHSEVKPQLRVVA